MLGIAFLVLFIGSILAQGDTPMSADSADDIRAFFVDNRDTYLISDFLTGIAIIFLWIPFMICLRSVLAQAEGEPGLLSTLFYTGALLFVAVGFVAGIGWGTLAMGAGDEALDDSTIKMLSYMSDYAFSGITFAFAITALGGSLVMLRTGLLARWPAYVGLAAVVLNIIGGAWVIDGDPEGALAVIGWIGMLLFAVWILVVSIQLLRQAEPVGAMEPATA